MMRFPTYVLVSVLCQVAPVALFYYWWLMNQKEASLPMIIHALGRGFYDVTLMMICASYGALMTGLVILFWFYDAGAFKSSHSDNAATFTFYVFVIVPFVVSEESLKALFVRQQQRRLARRSFESNAAAAIKNGDSDRVETGNRRRHRSSSSSSKSRDGHGSEASPAAAGNTMTRTHLVLSTATSVGYALSQAMGWVVVTHLALKQYHAGYQSNLAQQFGWMLLTGILVTAFGTPLQLLSGYLIGLEVTRDAWHWWSYALLVPALLRSAYYISGAGLLILLDGVFGALALWFLVNLGLCYALASRVQAVEAAMPAEYLTNVGYLRWGVAYGQLNAHDDDGDDGSGIQAGVQDAESLPSQRRQTRSNQQQLQHPREKAESSQGVVEMRTHTSSHRNSAACSGGSSGGGGIPASAATPAAASPPAAAAAAPKPVATRDSVMARLNAMKAAKAKGKTNASSPPSTADADATATMLSSRAAATTQHLSLPPGTSDSSSKSNSASSGGSGSRSGEVHNPIAASPGQFEYDNDGDEIAVL